MVGSHARGTARADSDIDLVLLLNDPGVFLVDTNWVGSFGQPLRQEVEHWGKVTSLRVWYVDGREVEYGLTGLDWGSDPTDEGDMRVIRDGIRVLYEREYADLLRTVGRIVEQTGQNRTAILAELRGQLEGPLDDDHVDLVNEFLAGL